MTETFSNTPNSSGRAVRSPLSANRVIARACMKARKFRLTTALTTAALKRFTKRFKTDSNCPGWRTRVTADHVCNIDFYWHELIV
jgi:hypothetical protein